jgi:hypothetical protein
VQVGRERVGGSRVAERGGERLVRLVLGEPEVGDAEFHEVSGGSKPVDRER